MKKKSPAGHPGFKLLPVLLICAAAVSALLFNLNTENNNENTATTTGGVLALPIDYHDFGDVSLRRGPVAIKVPVVNVGDNHLTLLYLTTSCGCTSARITHSGKTSPVFRLGNQSSAQPAWQAKLEPGQKATLLITYDPAAHPQFRGPAIREITLFSDDRLQPTHQLRIKVNQID